MCSTPRESFVFGLAGLRVAGVSASASSSEETVSSASAVVSDSSSPTVASCSGSAVPVGVEEPVVPVEVYVDGLAEVSAPAGLVVDEP